MTKLITIKVKGFEGDVKIRPMRNAEKFGLMQSIGMDLASLEKMASKKTKANSKDMGLDLSSLGKLFEKASELIDSVDLKNDEYEFHSWDDLDYHPSALSIQMQIVNVIFGMGK